MLAAVPAFGQRFLPAEIVTAEVITEEMSDDIMAAVDPPMFDLAREKVDPEKVTEARKQLLQLFRVNQPSVAYLQAVSGAITERMEDAVTHDSTLVRLNAMIVVRSTIDDGSKKWIDAGLKDDSDAVKRWAMDALGEQMLWWKNRAAAGGRGNDAKISTAIDEIVALVAQPQPPHPVVVGAALEALFKVNTPDSREALIELLNQRVALHVADPDLSYAAERAVIESFSNAMVIERPVDMTSIKGLSRAAARYSKLIVDQLQNGRITEDLEPGAETMLFQCLQAMASVSVPANAALPGDHAQVKGWIANARWNELKGLIEKDWAEVYAAPPFDFRDDDLAVAEPAE